ncbi:MAG: carotenoid 1,2-hydratase [Pirellulaceae bacterium]|nr:MAG: carotenoid 1,2-hydratase [Pirellulaceae bacterium]
MNEKQHGGDGHWEGQRVVSDRLQDISTSRLGRRAFLAGALSVVCAGCREFRNRSNPELTVQVNRLPGGEAGDPWCRAEQPRAWQFPGDHGAHPEYRLEWWYYTGNVWDAAGRRFGYQLTFFRTGVRWQPANESRWALRDVYIAHLAISDVVQRRHQFWQRIHRQGPGWAGVESAGRRIWNGDWESRIAVDSSGGTCHQLRAESGALVLDLLLTSHVPPVLHGQEGLSRKGSAPGNASYYYSFTRLKTQGRLQWDGQRFEVRGDSWMDHEFSSSFLEPSQQGWDWFSIQLDNDCELMLYQMRRKDGSHDPASSGTLVCSDGSSEVLSAEQFQLVPHESWKSSHTSGIYPIAWSVGLPQHDIELDVRALFGQQEMDTRRTTGMAYWEGAIDVEGVWKSRKVKGHGYLEMTGRIPKNEDAHG